MKAQKVKFKGEPYLLFGEYIGPLGTAEQYRELLPSFAFVMRSGDVMRYGQIIGTRADIEFLNETEEVSQ